MSDIERSRIADLETISELIPTGIFVVDENGVVVEANGRIFDIFNMREKTLDGGKYGDVLNCYYVADSDKTCGNVNACALCPLRLMIDKVLENGEAFVDETLSHEFEINGRKSIKWFTVNAKRADKGEKSYGVIIFSDVTDKMILQRELVKLGVLDELTGLFSRRYVLQQLEKELRFRNSATYPVTVALVGLDGFEQLNEALGEAAGDEVLMRLADMFRRHTRDTDYAGRFGEERLMLILEKCDAASAGNVLDRIRDGFAAAVKDVLPQPQTFSAGLVGISFEDIQTGEFSRFIEKAQGLLDKAQLSGDNTDEI